MLKNKENKNYLDYIPVKNSEIQYEIDNDGIVTVYIEWKGFYHKIAQRFFRKPRVSDIKLDSYGSFIWSIIDGEKDVYALSKEMEQHFNGMEKALSRLIKFLEIMHDHHLIFWKGEEKK